MSVHRRGGSIMKFNEYKSGLYYFDTAAPKTPNSTSLDVNNYLFLNTVEQNKQAYTRREIEGADRPRELYKKIGRPSEKEFTDILQNNLIRNCPMTPDDAKRALQIYGPDVATWQGKTVKKQNSGIPNYQAVQIPAPIIAQYNNVACSSIFFGSITAHIFTPSLNGSNSAPSQQSTTEPREPFTWKPRPSSSCTRPAVSP
jgi:hypothetical protein